MRVLSGPWVPLYGFACLAIAIIWNALAARFPVIAWPAVLILPTILEYLTAMIMERFFGIILWDYHDRRFNIKGRICLRFSAYWALLVVALILSLTDFSTEAVSDQATFCGFPFAVLIDTLHSIREVFNLRPYFKNCERQHKATSSPSSHPKVIKLPFDCPPLQALTEFTACFKSFVAIEGFPGLLRERIEKRFLPIAPGLYSAAFVLYRRPCTKRFHASNSGIH